MEFINQQYDNDTMSDAFAQAGVDVLPSLDLDEVEAYMDLICTWRGY